MHPLVTNELARLRQEELGRAADAHRPVHAAQRRKKTTTFRETFAVPRVAVRVTVAFSRFLRFR
jgi:hypothetical protein